METVEGLPRGKALANSTGDGVGANEAGWGGEGVGGPRLGPGRREG